MTGEKPSNASKLKDAAVKAAARIKTSSTKERLVAGAVAAGVAAGAAAATYSAVKAKPKAKPKVAPKSTTRPKALKAKADKGTSSKT